LEYLIEKYKDIRVYWTTDLDGGGRSFGQQFIPMVAQLIGPVRRLYEFCAGPGFIGFSLLANGFCDTLCLSDINPKAVEAAKKTVEENDLADRVSVYLSDGLSGILASERWDLVVGNPPHFCVGSEDEHNADIIQFDSNWRIHKMFYQQVHRFLLPHSSVLLIENYCGSDESVFKPLIMSGNLDFVESLMYCSPEPILNSHYFIWSRMKANNIVVGHMAPRTVRVLVSEMDSGFLEVKLEPFEKVQVEIVNDLDKAARIGLQMCSPEPEQRIYLPPRSTKTSGIILSSGVPLYLTHHLQRDSLVCSLC
jgi:predicted RNA methylase